VLLPELRKNNLLQSVPESLIVVLNTLHLVHPEGTRLIGVEKQSDDLIFEAEFDSRIDGKIVTDACEYKLHNYLSPERYSLDILKIKSSSTK
jgi:hypothetical protein